MGSNMVVHPDWLANINIERKGVQKTRKLWNGRSENMSKVYISSEEAGLLVSFAFDAYKYILTEN